MWFVETIRFSRGNRGAVRVCHAYLDRFAAVVLILAYPKNEKGNLTVAEKKVVRRYLEAIELRNASGLQIQTMKNKPKKTVGQQLTESLHGSVDALQSGDDIEATFNCRRVEVPTSSTNYNPELIKETRHLLKASQAVFAQFLGVSLQTVRAWEQGTNVPSDIAKRFMDEIRHNPEYWRGRLREVAIVKKRQPASPVH